MLLNKVYLGYWACICHTLLSWNPRIESQNKNDLGWEKSPPSCSSLLCSEEGVWSSRGWAEAKAPVATALHALSRRSSCVGTWLPGMGAPRRHRWSPLPVKLVSALCFEMMSWDSVRDVSPSPPLM